MGQDTFIVMIGIALLLIHDVLLELVYLKYDHNPNATDAKRKNEKFNGTDSIKYIVNIRLPANKQQTQRILN